MAHGYLGKGTVISISLEFYILHQEARKDYAWIFKIARRTWRGRLRTSDVWVFHAKIKPLRSAGSRYFTLDSFLSLTNAPLFHCRCWNPGATSPPNKQSKMENIMKRTFWSEGSVVAAQWRSRVHVCVCAQGLGAAYRFEQFLQAKILPDSWMRNLLSAQWDMNTRATLGLYAYSFICGLSGCVYMDTGTPLLTGIIAQSLSFCNHLNQNRLACLRVW